jgi:alpha-galactosidase
MQDLGYQAAGYNFVNLDDCWAHGRGADGLLAPVSSQFPSGMKHLGDELHALNFRFGIYSDAGSYTCSPRGQAGFLGHELVGAQTFDAWGVDYRTTTATLAHNM